MSEKNENTRAVSPEEMARQHAFAAAVRSQVSLDGRVHPVYIETFGCQQNEADSERLMGMATEMGYTPTDNAAQADLILVNTCAVREHAELKALSITGQFKHLKEQNPDLLIGICGCMVSQAHREEDIRHKYPYVDFLFGTKMLYTFPETLARVRDTHRRVFVPDEGDGTIAEGIPVVRRSRTEGWVSIMYGCNNFCTYCVVPYVRGRERSRSSADIIDEVRMLVGDGCREITLLGQNVNSYRGDAACPDFPTLLHAICRIPGDFTVRFMTSHPKDASDALIRCMAEEKKIAKQFHLPLQSGSDRILKAMNRRYTQRDYLNLVEKLRAQMPDIVLSTDIIVGFPGETEEDFLQTLACVQAAQYDSMFTFLYSKRKGTPAAELACQIDDETKKDRFSRLTELQNSISLEKNLRYRGCVIPVFVQGPSKTDKTMLSGRTDGNKLVHFKGNAAAGETVSVKITDASFFALFGEETES